MAGLANNIQEESIKVDFVRVQSLQQCASGREQNMQTLSGMGWAGG
jgi:hypothetical protein